MYGKQTTEFLSLTARKFGRGIGQFMLSVLLLNFLSTAILSASSADMRNSGQDDLLSGIQSVIICTPQGLKRITLDENGNPVGDNEGKLEHCVYCLPFHKLAIGSFSSEVDFPVVDLASYKPRYAKRISSLTDMPLNMACPPRAPPKI